MSPQEGLSILEALDNLNALVEVDSLAEIEITADDHIISHKEGEQGFLENKEVYWLNAGSDDQTVHAIKETFRSIYRYLQAFHKNVQKSSDPRKALEGVNTIMLLVGEAAQKLDRYSAVFKHRVYDFKEYKDLQSFFKKKVVQESFKDFSSLSVPEGEESLEEGAEADKEIYLLNAIDVVKEDTDYELFYLKKEDGRNFYTYELARGLKVACDFGQFAEEYFGDDPLLQIKNWEDKSVQVLAKRILSFAKRDINKFYKEAMRYKGMELVVSLHNALMALMLAQNPRNLIRQFALKGSHVYFNNFQTYLRQAIRSREFQKFLVYSPPESQPYFMTVMKLINKLAFALFTLGPWEQEVKEALVALNHRETKGKKEKTALSDFLSGRYQVLKEALKKHPNGPVFKALDLIREEEDRVYDPLLQGNLPTPECHADINKKEITFVRMPAPVVQEVINVARIAEEFSAYLRQLVGDKKLLVVDFQDKTSWKDHARAEALISVSQQAEFSETLTVIALSKDTDFYHQRGPYADLNEAKDFIDLFTEHLSDEATGYYFSRALKKELFPKWTGELLQKIHATYFASKKQLSHRERELFIELAYALIELKVIELSQPDLLSHLSKDGLDLASTATVSLAALLSLNAKQKLTDQDLDQINYILFGPTLMVRERAIHPQRFHRLYTMINYVEKTAPSLQPFKDLFKSSTLNAALRYTPDG